MQGDVLGWGPISAQQLGGTRVVHRSTSGGDIGVDRGAHERVHEAQRLPGNEQFGGTQRIKRVSGRRDLDFSHGRSVTQRHPVTKDGGGARQFGGVG